MTIVIVKISIPEVTIAVLKNLLIFGEKYLPQSVRLLEGGGVETLFGRIPFEHRFFFTWVFPKVAHTSFSAVQYFVQHSDYFAAHEMQYNLY